MEYFNMSEYNKVNSSNGVQETIYEFVMRDWQHHIFEEDGTISWEGYVRRYKEQVEITIINFTKWNPEKKKDISVFLNQVLEMREKGWKISFSLDEP